MKNIKMIVTDLDGTLLRSDKAISEYTADVIERLHKQKILFIIATARPVRAVKNAMPWLNYDAGIFHNGAVIFDRDKRVGSIGVKNAFGLVTKILAENPTCNISVEADDTPYANFDAGKIWSGMSYIKTSNFSELKGRTVDKVIVEATSLEEMERFNKYISDDLYIQLSENKIAMIMNKLATKTKGIELVAKQYDILLENIVSFGDDYNDIDMLKACCVGVAVSNAMPEVKNSADEICQDNDHDGVARWIEENILM